MLHVALTAPPRLSIWVLLTHLFCCCVSRFKNSSHHFYLFVSCQSIFVLSAMSYFLTHKLHSKTVIFLSCHYVKPSIWGKIMFFGSVCLLFLCFFLFLQEIGYNCLPKKSINQSFPDSIPYIIILGSIH